MAELPEEPPRSYSVIWRDPTAFPEEALQVVSTDEGERVWLLVGTGRTPAFARYLPRQAVVDVAHRLSQWVEATSNCPACDHPRSAHYQSTDWGSGCLLAMDSETGVHRCECKGLDGRGPRILVSL